MENLIKKYIEQNKECMYGILKEMCAIPAPSHFEHQRAEYCKKWLENIGATGVYIDDALNVIFPLNCEGSSEITVFAAHTDTVFPEKEPFSYIDDGEKIHCPGASDDTASVAILLLMVKFFIENKIEPKKGILFVCNSCEEGLGNLKGTKQLFNTYAGRIARFISFDSSLDVVYDNCVGSYRYEVKVNTVGGHSFSAFGNDNAIHRLSQIINEIYKIEVPQTDGSITTYNVGTISGGTSVNTIAQNAKMLCEYRSNNKKCMGFMEQKFEEIFENCRCDEVKVDVRLVGDRPCGDIDESKMVHFKSIVVPVIEGVIDKKVKFKTASTDCNIPLSLGIPALGVGLNIHSGVHTYEEWVDKKSMIDGFEIALRLGLALS